MRLLIRREDGRRETLDVTPRLPAPRAADASGEVNPQDSAGHGPAPADAETSRYLIGIGWEAKQPNFLWEISTVQPGGPAEQAGLRPGDVIAIELPLPWEVEGLTSVAVQRFAGDKLSEPFHVGVDPQAAAVSYEQVVQAIEKHSFIPAVGAAWHESLLILRLTYRTLQRLLVGHVPIKGMTGPVGIIKMTYQSSKPGFGYYLWFLAMISINLAVLNLLPIPVLDGGHLVFLTLEAVRRRPLSQRVQEYALWSGLAMLLSLILYVTWNDVMRLF